MIYFAIELNPVSRTYIYTLTVTFHLVRSGSKLYDISIVLTFILQ